LTKLVLILLLASVAVPVGDRSALHPVAVTANVVDGGATTEPRFPARRKWWIRWLQDLTPHNWAHAFPSASPGSDDARWLRHALYSSLRRGDCDVTLSLTGLTPLTEEERALYEGAAAACLAAFHGRSDLWPVAEARFDQVRGTSFVCQNFAVLRILREMVEAHRADSTAAFGRGRGRGVSCPAWTARLRG
jgi:hypothetical protein